jgi:putative membrane protein insertion efficiency factor
MLRKVLNFLPILAIKAYRLLLSPLLPPTCRFTPSCSAYGLKAFQTHSLLRASWLTLYRILRCNPFNRGGFDPVPGSPEASSADADKTTSGPMGN